MPSCSFCGVRLHSIDVELALCPVCGKSLTLRDRFDIDGTRVVPTVAANVPIGPNGESSTADFCDVSFPADTPETVRAPRSEPIATFDPGETVDLLAGELTANAEDGSSQKDAAAPRHPVESVGRDESPIGLADTDELIPTLPLAEIQPGNSPAAAEPADAEYELGFATVDLKELNLELDTSRVDGAVEGPPAEETAPSSTADSAAGNKAGPSHPHLTRPAGKSAARAKKH